jgi:lysozyme
MKRLLFAFIMLALLVQGACADGKFNLGDRVWTAADTSLNVREDPGTSSLVSDSLIKGTIGTVIEGPVSKDGHNWWNISYDVGAIGWSAEDWLELAPSAGSQPPKNFLTWAEETISWAEERKNRSDWDRLCMRFVANAFEEVEGKEAGGNADDLAKKLYRFDQEPDGWHNAPRGAVIFFDRDGDNVYGHVGICLGNGTLIHAYGTVQETTVEWAIAKPDVGRYLGWSYPSEEWRPQSHELHTISEDGITFIADHEGFVDRLYNDPGNHCTIGYGHLVHKGVCNGADPGEQEFLEGITEERARELFRSDLAEAEQAVNTYVTAPLTQTQFDALVSFTYNVGSGNFRDSALLGKLNEGRHQDVPEQLNLWVYSSGKLMPGLVTRRQDEGNLFQYGIYAIGDMVTLTIYVHDGRADGPVLAGVKVVGQDGAGNEFTQTTDEKGLIIIEGSPGTWQFNSTKSGYTANSWSQEITETSTKHAYLIAEESNATVSSSINTSIILLFDASSSMADEDKIDNAKEAAKNSIVTLGPKDEVALIVFYDCSRIIVEQPFTTDWSALAAMIDTIRPTGGTPLYAAKDFAQAYMDENARGEVRRIILLTDGIETCGGGPE